MIDHAKESGSFTITDLGRIAAKYYISHKSIMIFNRELGAHMTEERVLAMVSLSTEVSDLYHTPLYKWSLQRSAVRSDPSSRQ